MTGKSYGIGYGARGCCPTSWEPVEKPEIFKCGYCGQVAKFLTKVILSDFGNILCGKCKTKLDEAVQKVAKKYLDK